MLASNTLKNALAPYLPIPLVGLGTWRLYGEECTQAVHEAFQMGYRHFDTAAIYQNHQAIAKALKEKDRSSFFLTSKLSLQQVDSDRVFASVESACELTLKELGTDYLDLYLIHWPDRRLPMDEVYAAMQKMKEREKVRAIGVSNFTISHLKDLMRTGIPILANQVEFHPYLYQKELLDFCEQHQIQLISYRSLGKGVLCEDTQIITMGKKYEKSPAQIILRWLIQKGIGVIPKASSFSHLLENFMLLDFVLSLEDMEKLDHLNRDQRFCDGEWADFDY